MGQRQKEEWEDYLDRADLAKDMEKYKYDQEEPEPEPMNTEDICRHGFPIDVWCDKCELGLF